MRDIAYNFCLTNLLGSCQVHARAEVLTHSGSRVIVPLSRSYHGLTGKAVERNLVLDGSNREHFRLHEVPENGAFPFIPLPDSVAMTESILVHWGH